MSERNSGQQKTGLRGTYLEDLTWEEAEPILHADPVVVIPIGAAAKEHGRHLPLGTDRIMADYLAEQLARRIPCWRSWRAIWTASTAFWSA